MSLKFTGELRVMTMTNDAKFKEKLTQSIESVQNRQEEFAENLKNLNLNGLFLTKVCNF